MAAAFLTASPTTAFAQEQAQMVVTATVRPSCRFEVPQSQADVLTNARVTCGRASLRSLRVSTDAGGRIIGLARIDRSNARAFGELQFALPGLDARLASTRLSSVPRVAVKPLTVSFDF